ncbi:uncharacterized protein LOC100175330 [Ciona intestinalis]
MPLPGIMKIDKLSKIQREANVLLKEATMDERSSRYNKVVEKYKKMLKSIHPSNLPASFMPTSSYNMLLYESYYHLGTALQNLGRYKESVHAFTNAMLSMNLRKNGCMAGCDSNTCFQTPVLAKRALAHAKTGDLKNAFRDIEKAVVLDARNPDLYCVRALLWSTRKENEKAIEDLDKALAINRCHVCALLLRGTVDQPFQLFGLLEGISTNVKKDKSVYHQEAIKINHDAAQFTDVGSVHSPKIIPFWNRFLWSLNVPRTVMHVDLTSAIISQYNNTIVMQEQPPAPQNRSTSATPLVSGHRNVTKDVTNDVGAPKPFRCGTPHKPSTAPATKTYRRLSYGEAIRTYSAKRQDTGVSEYIQRLVAHASRPTTAQSLKTEIPVIKISRPPSCNSPARSISRRSSTHAAVPINHLHSPTLYPQANRRQSVISVSSCPIPYNRGNSPSIRRPSLAPPSERRRASIAAGSSHEGAANFATLVHGIEVFNKVNVDEAPRMYYKPWGGDKLPVAQLPQRAKLEAFRV